MKLFREGIDYKGELLTRTVLKSLPVFNVLVMIEELTGEIDE